MARRFLSVGPFVYYVTTGRNASVNERAYGASEKAFSFLSARMHAP